MLVNNLPIEIDEKVTSRRTDRTLAMLEYSGRFSAGQSRSEFARRCILRNRSADLTRPQIHNKSLTLCSWDAPSSSRDNTGETTKLVIMAESNCLILEQCVSDQPIKVSCNAGLRIPYYSCVPRKSIFAELSQQELDDYLQTVNSKKFTDQNLATTGSVKNNLNCVRKTGYVLDQAEGLEGIDCVYTIVLDDYEYPVGSITTIGPAFRMTPKRFQEIGKFCIRSAMEIRAKPRT